MPPPIDVRTQAPFVDARAADLRLAVGPMDENALRPALATRPGPAFREYATELRVLGASHQITLCGPDASWMETLAADPTAEPGAGEPGAGEAEDGKPAAAAYPMERATRLTADLRHGVTVTVDAADTRSGLACRADEIERRCRAHDTSLIVRFADDPLAFTAIGASTEADVLSWETWHLYPDTREIVTSISRVTREIVTSISFLPSEE